MNSAHRTRLTQGYHSADLFESVRRAWVDDDHLLVVVPPMKTDLSFLEVLPGGPRAAEFPEKPIFGVFTSGTVSGKPRLVLYSRKNIESALDAVLNLFDRSRITSVFAYPQPFHTFGLTLGYLLALKLEVPLRFHAGKYSQESHATRASFTDAGMLTLGTPAHFFDLCSLIRGGLKVAPSYSCIIGGASVDAELWREVRDTTLIEAPSIGYGCTEASPAVTHLAPGVEPSGPGEIGFPLDNLNSRVVPDVGVEISGPSLCMAIVETSGAGNASDYKVVFPNQLTISDNIEVREDGAWIFHGRLDLRLNRGGSKIPLEEVESVLKEKLGLFAIAFAVPSARLGQDLAIAVRFPDESLANSNSARAESLVRIDGAEDVRTHVMAVIAEHFSVRMAKENIVMLEHFPLSESAKIDRAAIARDFLSKTPAPELKPNAAIANQESKS